MEITISSVYSKIKVKTRLFSNGVSLVKRIIFSHVRFNMLTTLDPQVVMVEFGSFGGREVHERIDSDFAYLACLFAYLAYF